MDASSSIPEDFASFDELLRKFGKHDISRGFGSNTPLPPQGLYTFPEDAFLANPNKMSVFPNQPSPYYYMLPTDFREVISKPMYSMKTQRGEHGHCKHTCHMFEYLFRVAGGAPHGVSNSISAPYFDPAAKQVFYSFAESGWGPRGDQGLGYNPMPMPVMIKESFESRGWVVYNDFLQTLDALFVHQSKETGMKVMIVDVKSQPQLNGQIGVVKSFDTESQRYVIEIDGKMLKFKAANLADDTNTIAYGSKAVVQGLKAKPELNGRIGTVKKFVEDSSRYEVRVDGSDYRLKRDNLELTGSRDPLVDLIFLDLDMFGYDYQSNGEQGHGILVFKLKTSAESRYRVVHSFAGAFSLQQWLSGPGSDWWDEDRMRSYIREGVKPMVFSRAEEKEAATRGILVVFQGMDRMQPHFRDAEWAQRKGFSNGQSLGLSVIASVPLQDLLDVMRRFHDTFAEICLR